MRVTFVLPMQASWPIGGFKIVYEYASRLARRGHSVTVLHLRDPSSLRRRRRLYEAILPWATKWDNQSVAPWFQMHPEVALTVVPKITEATVPDADIIVATAWQTAEWVAPLMPRHGRKLYFVQDYEYYMTADDVMRARMIETFRGPFETAAISPVVSEMLAECGVVNSAYLPNGIALEEFSLQRPIADSERSWIGFPVRDEPFKRTEDAVAAISHVREGQQIKTEVWAFGRHRPDWLPSWVTFYDWPSTEHLRSLYNKTAIFVTASEYEGWGLPGAEAMACGAALVSTDHGGVRAYAQHKGTALLSKPLNVEALAANILHLTEDDAARQRLAEAGCRHIQQFTWDSAVDRFEGLLSHDTTVPQQTPPTLIA